MDSSPSSTEYDMEGPPTMKEFNILNSMKPEDRIPFKPRPLPVPLHVPFINKRRLRTIPNPYLTDEQESKKQKKTEEKREKREKKESSWKG